MGKFQAYMTIKQAAEYLGVTANTLRNWGREGKIKERRHPINGYRLYRQEELDRLVHRVERTATTHDEQPAVSVTH